MLAGTPAAEVISSQQNLTGLGRRRVQHKIGLRLPAGIIPPVVKQLIRQPILGNRLQKSRRNDLIGIDIIDRQRNQLTFKRSELDHPSKVLTSVITPVTAVAAAVSGL